VIAARSYACQSVVPSARAIVEIPERGRETDLLLNLSHPLVKLLVADIHCRYQTMKIEHVNRHDIRTQYRSNRALR
jgi:hypothetical protein